MDALTGQFQGFPTILFRLSRLFFLLGEDSGAPFVVSGDQPEEFTWTDDGGATQDKRYYQIIRTDSN